MKNIVSAFLVTVILVGTLVMAFDVRPVRASGTIYIRTDGSIDPADAPISTFDNVTYVLTGNITSDAGGIVVQRSNIIVDGNGYTLQGTGSGIGIYWSVRKNVTIRNTNIKDFFEGIRKDYQSADARIVGNNVTNNKCGVALSSFTYYSSISGNNIEANVWYGIWLDCVSVPTASGNNITNNDITNSDFGIWLDWSSSNSISGNNITDNQDGIILAYSDHNSISGNHITNNYGIGLYCSNYNSINGNNITNDYYGIDLDYSNYSIVSGNSITNNSDGLELNCSSSNIISGNNITNNSNYGVALFSSSDNSVSENDIESNSFGVFLYYSSTYNAISGNTIADNSYGIEFCQSSDNTICHNSFDNVRQTNVIIDQYPNIWDNGCEGNYWSDYTGTDSDGDGVGDMPYVIDRYNVDNCPLINRYWIPADVNNDLIVNILDVVKITGAYGATPLSPHWNPHADIAKPFGKIDIFDIVLCTSHYGQEWP